MGSRTLITAEIGKNQIGNCDMAREITIAATDADADLVKFQSYHGTDVAEWNWLANVDWETVEWPAAWPALSISVGNPRAGCKRLSTIAMVTAGPSNPRSAVYRD